MRMRLAGPPVGTAGGDVDGGSGTGGVVDTVAPTYAAALVCGLVGLGVGLVVPCEGFLCSFGGMIVGALLGMLASAPVAAWRARREGVRWWYTPIAYLGVLALLAWALSLPAVWLDDAQMTAFAVTAAGCPLLGAAAAARLRPWVRGLLVGVVVVSVVAAHLAVSGLPGPPS